MSYDENCQWQDDDDEDIEECNNSFEEKVIPTVRIYISYTKHNHDQLDIPEVIAALSQSMSPQNTIKELIDRGMINIYACCFNNVHKVI